MNNHEAIAQYYTACRHDVVRFIAARTGDAEAAADAVQDIFLRLLDGHQLTTPQTLPCLVYTMARHHVADYYRRRRVSEEYEHYLKHRGGTAETAESVISAQQLMERMERSLARLPQDCCRIYRLHIYDGLRVSEIAHQLDMPYKSVENRLGQARRTVRQQLKTAAVG